jgi:hypothetical protein
MATTEGPEAAFEWPAALPISVEARTSTSPNPTVAQRARAAAPEADERRTFGPPAVE